MNSIRFKLVIVVLAFLIPFIILLGYIDFYAIKVIREQVAASNQNVIELHLKQLDNNLKDMDQYLADLAVTSTDISLLETKMDSNTKVLSSVRLKNKISNDIIAKESTDAIFVYSVPENIFIHSQHNELLTAKQIQDPKVELIRIINDKEHPVHYDVWQPIQMEEEYYLVRILRKGQTYVGAWIRIGRVLSNFEEKFTSIFVANDGTALNEGELLAEKQIDVTQNYEDFYISGEQDKFLVVGKKSMMGSFGVVSLMPESQLLQGFPYVTNVILLSIGTTLLLIPLYLIFLRKTVLIPMKRILSVMKKIRKGNIEERIESFQTSEEFELLYETFNSMVTQIKELKIDIYEEKITRQRAELEQLKLQVKPHFFLNTLNIMNSLARSRNYELLQEMSLCLIQYFRYMFRSNLEFVSLQDELHHVKNYVHIQELRFPESLRTHFEVSECLLDTPVPPLIIHNFIENTIKHSVTLDEPIYLSITARLMEQEGDYRMRITVSDTGKGFSEAVLHKLQRNERIIDEYGEHIGIFNVQKRLELLYNGHASLSCYNNAVNGAVVDIILPMNNQILTK